MTSLKEFLEDTQIAIDNGFGKKETILRMFNALYATMELHKPEVQEHGEYEKCWNCNLVYPCPTVYRIEAELG